MRQGQISMTLDIAGYETAMEGEDMRAVVLTLDQGQTVPSHYHTSESRTGMSDMGQLRTLDGSAANDLRKRSYSITSSAVVSSVSGTRGRAFSD